MLLIIKYKDKNIINEIYKIIILLIMKYTNNDTNNNEKTK